MPNIAYLNDKQEPVHMSWQNNIQGVVVLHHKNMNLSVTSVADVYKFLCDVRFGQWGDQFFIDNPVDFTEAPMVYQTNIEGHKVDLSTIESIVVKMLHNWTMKIHKDSKIHCVDSESIYRKIPKPYRPFEENFDYIFLSDEQRAEEVNFHKKQESLRADQEKKDLAKRQKQFESFSKKLMENMERELNRKAKDLGIKNKKPSRKGEGGDRLLFRMGQ